MTFQSVALSLVFHLYCVIVFFFFFFFSSVMRFENINKKRELVCVSLLNLFFWKDY